MKTQKNYNNNSSEMSSLDKLEEIVTKVIKQKWEIAEEKVILYEEKRG